MIERTDFEGLPVKVELLNIKKIPLHAHEDLQVMMVLEGEVELFLAIQKYTVKAGQVQFIQLSDIHMMTANEDNVTLLITIDIDYASKLYPHIGFLIFTTRFEGDTLENINERNLLYNTLINLTEKYLDANENSGGDIVKSTEYLLHVLYDNFRGFRHVHLNKGFQYNTLKDSIQVDRVSGIVQEVYERYENKLSLTEIADRHHLSVYYLSHLFQQSTGISFRDFVSMARVEKALYPMLTSDLPLSRVAFNVGFSHYSFFEKNFIKWYEVSPEEFREKMKREMLPSNKMEVADIDYNSVKNLVYRYCKQTDNTKEESDLINLNLNKLEYDSSTSLPVILNLKPDETTSSEYRLLLSKISNVKCRDRLNHIIKIREDITGRDDRDAAVRSSENFSEMYGDYDFNIALNELYNVNEPTELNLYDDHKGKRGLFTKNGLYKPAYYIFVCMLKLFDERHYIKDGIISRNGNNYRILLVNKSRNYPNEIYLKLSSKFDYICSIEYIESHNTSIRAWNRLNFMELDENLKNKVNNIAKPVGEFFLIEKSGKEHMLTLYPNTVSMIELVAKF